MFSFSKNQIRQLGKTLRKETIPSRDSLEKLQSYRKSFQKPISDIFSDLSIISKKVYTESIASMRLKRIDTIIHKLHRFNKMELDRMWDVAGCRFIMKNERQVYKLSRIIENKYFVKKKKDYYKEKQNSGYKSLHLYIRESSDSPYTIEVQIRTKKDHNWATLVEITDLLYDEDTKETNNFETTKFGKFHALLSNNIEDIPIKQKKAIINTAVKNQFYNTLSSIFIKNYINVRNQWENQIRDKKSVFFVIEIKNDKSPVIKSFNGYEEAENEYFNLYIKEENSNVLLIHLANSNYKQISIAYSNYILTMHTFVDDFILIIQDIIIQSLVNRNFIALKKYLMEYAKVIKQTEMELEMEYKAISDNYLSQNNAKITKNIRMWEQELGNRINKIKHEQNKFVKQLISKKPNNFIYSFIFKRIILSVAQKIK